VIVSDGITDGFKMAAPYGDVTGSPFNMPTELPRNLKLQIRTVTCHVSIRIADELTDRLCRR